MTRVLLSSFLTALWFILARFGGSSLAAEAPGAACRSASSRTWYARSALIGSRWGPAVSGLNLQVARLFVPPSPIGNAQKSLSEERDRWFESDSLQR